MPYCKECGYEYTPGIKSCPDCMATLEQGDLITCDACDEIVKDDEAFCHHCGVILAWAAVGDATMYCETHRDNEAVGSCVICRKVLCNDCAVKRNGRYFCDNDEHVKAAFNWVAACTMSTDYEAEMIKANLQGAGIPAMVLSQHDHTYVTTVGDLAQTDVMVPNESLEEARRFIRSVELEGSTDDQEN